MNRPDLLAPHIRSPLKTRRIPVALGGIAVICAVTAFMAERRYIAAAVAVENELTAARRAIPAPMPASAPPLSDVHSSTIDASSVHRFLPSLAAIAASNAIRVPDIELDRNRKSGDTSGRAIRLTLQGSYQNTRAALSELLEQTPGLLVEHVNWQRTVSQEIQ